MPHAFPSAQCVRQVLAQVHALGRPWPRPGATAPAIAPVTAAMNAAADRPIPASGRQPTTRNTRRRRDSAQHPVKYLREGEQFTWLGEPHTLRLVTTGPPVHRHDRPTRRLLLHRDHAHNATALVHWYTRSGVAWLTGLSDQDAIGPRRWERILRIRHPVTYTAHDLGERPIRHRLKGAPQVTFHWAVFQLAPAQIDYLLACALIHIAAGRNLPSLTHMLRLNALLPTWHDHSAAIRQVWPTTWTGAVHPASEGTGSP